jgi:antitoxin VapB
MSLNIKNPRVHEMAREVARRTGLTQTGAVEAALERMLDELGENPSGIDDLIAGLQTDIAAHGPLSMDDLYDESGLPT